MTTTNTTNLESRLEALESLNAELFPFAEKANDLGIDINQKQATGRLQQIADRANEWCATIRQIRRLEAELEG